MRHARLQALRRAPHRERARQRLRPESRGNRARRPTVRCCRLPLPLLKGRENLDSFDRIDPEVGIEAHAQVEHLDRVAGFLGNHFEQQGFEMART